MTTCSSTSGPSRTPTWRSTRERSGWTSPGARALSEHTHAERVREDFMSGIRSGVNGTPTFFINGVRHDDGYEAETLLSALKHAASQPDR